MWAPTTSTWASQRRRRPSISFFAGPLTQMVAPYLVIAGRQSSQERFREGLLAAERQLDATADDQGRPGDVAGEVAGEEQGGVADLLGRPAAAHPLPGLH